MWKKTSQLPTPAETKTKMTAPPVQRQEPRPSTSKSRIGPGIVIRGDVQGGEDLVIEGRVEGKIVLEQHSVVVEESGNVSAEIVARNVRVAGEVRGNINASEQAVLMETARLEGDLTAKGVTIETGARFKGSIDMEVESRPRAAAAAPRRETVQPAGVNRPNGASKPVGVA